MKTDENDPKMSQTSSFLYDWRLQLWIWTTEVGKTFEPTDFFSFHTSIKLIKTYFDNRFQLDVAEDKDEL